MRHRDRDAEMRETALMELDGQNRCPECGAEGLDPCRPDCIHHERKKAVCPECDGKRVRAIPYFEATGSGAGMSIERAARMAGEIHHYDACPECDGRGWVWEDGEYKLDDQP